MSQTSSHNAFELRCNLPKVFLHLKSILRRFCGGNGEQENSRNPAIKIRHFRRSIGTYSNILGNYSDCLRSSLSRTTRAQ